MLAIKELNPKFVESAPRPLELGVLYISIRFRTALHLCCCGCGREVVTPFSPAKWTLLFHGRSVSLFPSIGNWSTCRSHYVIRENHVIEARPFADYEIEANIAIDEARSRSYYRGEEIDSMLRWERLLDEGDDGS